MVPGLTILKPSGLCRLPNEVNQTGVDLPGIGEHRHVPHPLGGARQRRRQLHRSKCVGCRVGAEPQHQPDVLGADRNKANRTAIAGKPDAARRR